MEPEKKPVKLDFFYRRTIQRKKDLIAKYPNKNLKLHMCLAKLRGKEGLCHTHVKHPWNRCKIHGGRGGRPIESGRYSRMFKGQLHTFYEEFRHDSRLLDLRDEIAALRALLIALNTIRVEYKNAKQLGPYRESVQEMTRVIDTIGKSSERLMKIQTTFFSLQSLQTAITQMITILRNRINNCPHCGKELDILRRAISQDLLTMRVIHVQNERTEEQPEE